MQPVVTILLIAVAAWVNRHTGVVMTSYLVAPNIGAPDDWPSNLACSGQRAIGMVLTGAVLAALFVRSLGVCAPRALVAAVLVPIALLLLRLVTGTSSWGWDARTASLLCSFVLQALSAAVFALRLQAWHGQRRERHPAAKPLRAALLRYSDGAGPGWVHLIAVAAAFTMLLIAQEPLMWRLDPRYFAPSALFALVANDARRERIRRWFALTSPAG